MPARNGDLPGMFDSLTTQRSPELPPGKRTQLWKITFFHGEINYKWQFSIATVGLPGICEHTLSGEKWCFSIAKCRNSQSRRGSFGRITRPEFYDHHNVAAPSDVNVGL